MDSEKAIEIAREIARDLLYDSLSDGVQVGMLLSFKQVSEFGERIAEALVQAASQTLEE